MLTKSTKIHNSISLLLLTALFSGMFSFNHAWADEENENKNVVESTAPVDRSQKARPQAVKQFSQNKTKTTTNNQSTLDK